jgi:hypothetical protein
LRMRMAASTQLSQANVSDAYDARTLPALT